MAARHLPPPGAAVVALPDGAGKRSEQSAVVAPSDRLDRLPVAPKQRLPRHAVVGRAMDGPALLRNVTVERERDVQVRGRYDYAGARGRLVRRQTRRGRRPGRSVVLAVPETAIVMHGLHWPDAALSWVVIALA